MQKGNLMLRGKHCVLLVVLCFAVTTAAAAKKRYATPVKVLPGVPMKAKDILPYEPPKLAPEPPLLPTDVKVVEIMQDELSIEQRPWSSPLIGTTVRGMRLPVKGAVPATRGN